MDKKYDFSGWVTKNDVKCSDGRIIRHNAFADQSGTKVPLVWMHQHNAPENVLGSVLLQNRPEGVYGYGSLNESESADTAKLLLKHDDITAMSIYANNLTSNGPEVIHGTIREVSLVLAGANPEARIEEVLVHGETDGDSFIFYNAEDDTLMHSNTGEATIEYEPVEEDTIEHADTKKEDSVAEENTNTQNTSSSERTVQDVIDSMTDEQRTVMYALIGQAIEESGGSDSSANKEDNVKHNVFDQDDYITSNAEDAIIHDAMQDIISDASVDIP